MILNYSEGSKCRASDVIHKCLINRQVLLRYQKEKMDSHPHLSAPHPESCYQFAQAWLVKPVQVSSCWSVLKLNPEWVKSSGTSSEGLLSKLLIVFYRIDAVLACFQGLCTLLFHSGYMRLMLCINLESIFHSCYFQTISFSIFGYSDFEPA